MWFHGSCWEKLSFEGRLHCMFVIICLIRFEHRSIMLFICFDAWWWRVLSTHGRAAGYHCLNIIRNSLICLLMSESVCGRPSFTHVDTCTGVWPGRSLTKAGAYVAWLLQYLCSSCSIIMALNFAATFDVHVRKHGRRAGYQRLRISGCWSLVIFHARQCKKSWAVTGCFPMEHEAELVLNMLICLLTSESVCGRPSFIHVDAWIGVWPGRISTKAALRAQSAGCGL
jgi:hypothetical protein